MFASVRAKRADPGPGRSALEGAPLREANDAFRTLVKARPENPEYKVRWGRLLAGALQ